MTGLSRPQVFADIIHREAKLPRPTDKFQSGDIIAFITSIVPLPTRLGSNPIRSCRPRWNVPMLYVFGFLFTFVIGGLTRLAGA